MKNKDPQQIVFDIETVGCSLADLSESQQEYLLREANKETDEEIKNQKMIDAERFLSLYPFTAKVVTIGIYSIQKEKSFVYYESENEEEWSSEDGTAIFKGMREEKILSSFWRVAEKADQFITFNGRGFDIPFLMLRSAMLKIKPTKNLIGYRYDKSEHIDLLEQLSFYGVYKKFNLDFYCNSFGIKSPKSKEVSGFVVKDLYHEKRIKDIAKYCEADIKATYKLYKIWNDYLKF